jgi:hypothetical protein
LIFKILEEMSFMKKIKLIIAAASLMGMVSSSAVYADGFAPGEGLYVGAFAGVATGMVQPKVTTTAATTTTNAIDQGGTFEAKEGGLGMAGMEGGAWIGYGYKMGDLYAGFEGEIASGDVEFKLTSDIGIKVNGSDATNTDITEVSAKKDWTGGAFGRVGYYVNQDTLLSVRGGVLVSKFDVKYGTFNETFYGGGPSVGTSLSSRITAIDPNLSVRIGAVYTNYLTAPVSGIGSMVAARGGSTQSGVDSEITGSALSARLGLSYSFFDVNSLF